MSVDYGLTLTGFKIKSYDKIREDLVARAREYYGETLDERSTNPLIKFIEDIAQEFAFDWQIMQQIFANLFLVSANGIHLDKLGFELSLDRKEGTTARVLLKITGNVGFVVPTGSRFSTAPTVEENAVIFETETQLTIGEEIESKVAGPKQTDEFDDGDGPGGAGNPFDLSQEAYNDATATCAINGIPQIEVFSSPSSGEFWIKYGATKELEIGSTLTTGDVVICNYTYPASFNGTTSFTLDYIPVDPIIQLYRNSTQLTEVPSAPGANEFSCNYVTGVITLGQTIVITDVFTITYLNVNATYDEVFGKCTEIGIQGNVEPQKITIIVSVLSGVSAVTNETAATGGTEIEDDTDYRERLIAISRTQWTKEKIESELENIEGIRSATVISSFVIDEFVLGDEIGSSPLTFELSEEPTEPLKRAEIQQPSGQFVLTETSSSPPPTGEFQVLYPSENPSGPWEIEIFDTDLTVNDKLIVSYTNDIIGEGFFNVLIVGDETPVSSEVLDDVREKLLEVKPLSIGFQILEPEQVQFDTDTTIIIEDPFTSSDLPTIENAMETEIDSYIEDLEVEDPIIRNEIIKRFMLIDGVEDITELKFTLYDEKHVYATGVNTIDIDWAQFETILYVKSLDKQTDYPYTSDKPNNQITLTGGPYPGDGDTFVIKYETITGNVSPRSAEIVKRNEVTATE